MSDTITLWEPCEHGKFRYDPDHDVETWGCHGGRERRFLIVDEFEVNDVPTTILLEVEVDGNE